MKINTHLNILLITILFYINIKYIDNATLNNCDETKQYYNTINYECMDFNSTNNSINIEFDTKTLNSICAYGYYNNSNKCEKCEDYKVSSGNRQKCVECADEEGAYSSKKYGNYTIMDNNNNNITIYTCGCETIQN